MQTEYLEVNAMKKLTKSKLCLIALLVLTAVFLSGCYTEPEVIGGGTDSTYGGSVPFDTYAPKETPTPTPVVTSPVRTNSVVIFPNTQTMGPAPTQNGSATVILPQNTPEIATNTPITMTPTPTKSPTATPTSNVLKVGSTGPAVKNVQEKLKKLGYYRGSVDGNFGTGTKNAVIAFQKANKLTADGVVGTKTLEKINTSKVTAKPTMTPTPKPTKTPAVSKNTYLKKGSSGTNVKTMQTRLIELGYLNGKATGKVDAVTEQAIIAFQKRNTSYADGIAGYETLMALYKSSAKKASSSVGIIGLTLKDGSKETAAIKTLQRKLKSLGYYSGSIDGAYGESTQKAVKTFQQQNGVKTTGVAASATFEALFGGDAKKYSDNGSSDDDNPTSYKNVTKAPSGMYPTLSLGMSGTPVKTLQTYLKKAGYYKGTVDGKYGQSTFDAVKAFQRAKGLTSDGIAGAATQRILIEGDFPLGS